VPPKKVAAQLPRYFRLLPRVRHVAGFPGKREPRRLLAQLQVVRLLNAYNGYRFNQRKG